MRAGVYFDPPLRLQRQRWILTQLGLHSHSNFVEIGSGEGVVLRSMIEPPLWVQAGASWKEGFRKATALVKHPFLEPAKVAPRRVTAIDVDRQSIDRLAGVLKLPAASREVFPACEPRWYDLRVDLLHGSFVNLQRMHTGNIDILLASEVIEHLEEHELNAFGPVVFGRLRPGVVLITTPNYGFNVHFERAGSEKGFADPTQRTKRVFRHDDHKFEWTRAEFAAWCKDVSEAYGYTFNCQGIGKRGGGGGSETKADEKEESDDTYATQAAIFVKAAERSGMEATDDSSIGDVITLAHTHTYAATPVNLSIDQKCIDKIWKEVAEEERQQEKTNHDDTLQSGTDVYDLWMDEAMRVACAGKLEAFLPNPSELSVCDETVRRMAI